MPNRIISQIKKIIKQRKKELNHKENLSDVFTLRCEICGSTKTKYDGKDFELWDKDLWEKDHKHGIIRRLLSKLRRR